MAAGVGGVVVDVADDRGQQRVGAGGMVTPARAGEQGCEFHAAGPVRIAVPAWRGSGTGLAAEPLDGHEGPTAASGLVPPKSASLPTVTPGRLRRGT
jgi:hypothetical protein